MTPLVFPPRSSCRERLLFLGLSLLIALYLLFSETASRAVREGLLLCGQTLLPSLFPLLVLNGCLMRSGAVEALGRRLSPMFHTLFGISGDFAAPMLAGALCGFPTGAAGVVALCRQGRYTEKECLRGLLLASSASPGFLLVGVGEGMLGDRRLGVVLYLSQLLALLAVAFLLARFDRITPSQGGVIPSERPPFAVAFRLSLGEAVQAMLSVCGAVLFFSGITGILLSLPLSLPLLCLGVSFCELTSGVSLMASSLPPIPAIVGIAAAVGWSGLSVHAQVATLGERLPLRGYLALKLLTALLSALLCLLFLRFGAASAALFS